MKLLRTFAISSLLFACQSGGPVRPPDPAFYSYVEALLHNKDARERQDLSISERQAQAFVKAKLLANEGNHFHACARYQMLASDKTFALHTLAKIRTLAHCKLSKIGAQSLWIEEGQSLPQWMEEEFANLSLPVAEKFGLHRFIAKFSIMLVRHQKNQRDRERFSQAAIEAATRTGDTSLITQARLALYKVAPRHIPSPLKNELMSVAKNFEEVRDFSRARGIYKKIINDKTFTLTEKNAAWIRHKTSFKIERDKKGFVLQSKEMTNWLSQQPPSGEQKKLLAQAKIDLARALWTEHLLTEGRNILIDLIKNTDLAPNEQASLYWVLGSMELERGKNQEALDFYIRGVNANSTDKDIASNLGWAVAWNNFLLKRYEQASLHFRLIQENPALSSLKNRALFWEAISLERRGESEAVTILLDKLIQQDPFGYYGIMATIKLGRQFSPLKEKEVAKADIGAEFSWLVFLKEYQLARNLLEIAVKTSGNSKKIDQFLPLYRDAHWYDGGMNSFFSVHPDERNNLIADHTTTIFPHPFDGPIERASRRFGIGRDLINAIIRQESAFDTNARSWADAFGLMQLTPERAKSLARINKLSYGDWHDLFDPEINIPLGTAALFDLKRRWNGDLVALVASYNANPNAVKHWFATRNTDDLLVFIERIPYEETRNYVRLVIRNAITYRRLRVDQSFKMQLQDLDKIVTD